MIKPIKHLYVGVDVYRDLLKMKADVLAKTGEIASFSDIIRILLKGDTE